MRMKLVSAAAVSLLWGGAARAATVDDYDIPYVGAAYLYEFGDSSRDSDGGQGVQAHFGWPLTEFGYANWAAELTFHTLGRDRDIDGKSDYQNGLMLDAVYDFGLFGWGDETSSGVRFKPFLLAGLGGVQDDVRGSKHEHFGVNLGGGALFPLKWHGLAVRTEARVLGQANDKSVADEDVLFDYRLTVGLQIPLTPLFKTADREESAPAQACELAVVDPVTGRSDCGVDADRDGVLDSVDQCPATPVGVPVDARGCPGDLSSDSDGDSVPDQTDRCPGTQAGASVDAVGCIVGQTLMLRDIRFENGAAVLTAESRTILDDVAASLKSQPNVRVEIGGHTDNVGNDSYNHMLSQERAEAVRQYLIGRGVEADRLIAMGYGELQPIASNETVEGREQNRRVEFKLVVD